MFLDLPQGEGLGEHMSLWELAGQGERSIPCQPDPAVPGRLWWIAVPVSGADQADFEIREGRKSGEAAVSAVEAAASLTVARGGSPVLVYRHAPVPPPEGKSANYTRSGFIHPLYSPGGEVLSAMHPGDHVHHFGLWNPWRKTTFEGRETNFWEIGNGRATVRFVRFESITSGPVFGGFRAVHEHVDAKAPGGEKAALREIWDVRVWNVGKSASLVDFVTSQSCASESPLTIEAYRYGGFGFRGRLGWHAENSDCLTSEGKTRANGNASQARWCHVYGDTPKGGAGVLFMSHPENRAHPEPMRLWPPTANKGRDNIFFNFCPTQKVPWTLEPGNTYVLRYRMSIYDGKPSTDGAEALWRAFSAPPKAVCLDGN